MNVPFFDGSLTYLSRRRRKLKLPQRKSLLSKRLLNQLLQNHPNRYNRNKRQTKRGRTMKKVLQLVPRAAKRRKRKSQRRRRSPHLLPRRRQVVSVR